MEWFRYHTRTLDSAKVQGLTNELFRAWANLLCVASIHGGTLPDFPEIAFRLRCTEQKASAHVTALVTAKLIDRNEYGRFEMHDWSEHQYVSDNSTPRVKKHREKQKRNVSGTPPEQNRTETEQTQKETAPKSAALPSVRDMRNRFEEFVSCWPRVANPDHAARAYLSCIDNAGDEDLAFAARDRYMASDEVSRGVVMDPARWLMDQKSAKWGGKWPGAQKNNNTPYRKDDFHG